jgi:lipid II:glycine glycyltransferase (peptidoglycan interpeptide bridge formation enzyme)
LTLIKTIDPLTDKRWDAFITDHPESTIFHHSAWARILTDIYQCHPAYYILENEDGEISAAAPFMWLKSPLTGKRLVCLPHSELCYPLGYHEEDLGKLIAAIKDELNSSRSSYLEIRGWGKSGNPAKFNLKEHSYFLTHTIDLDGGLQKIRAGMDRNGRYNLRYTEKKPINIRVGQDEADLKQFYRLTTITRKRHNLLPQPYRYFMSIYQHLIVPGHGYLLLAELMGKIVAANMYFCFKDIMYHEFNAQDPTYFEYRPNYLLVWKAIERACQESYRSYNFGRTHRENQALSNFKKHWGSEETILPYYFYPDVHGTSTIAKSSNIYKAYTTVNKFMPPFLLKYAGELLFRHMG